MSGGWIKLHRELLDKSIWQESTAEQKVILITLMGMANFKANKWEFKGEQYELQPGQFITSVKSIVAKCGPGITTQNVRTALKRFEKLEFLTIEPTNKNTLITLVNWGFYQSCEDELTNELTNASQTPNNYRRSKEIKNINSADESTPAAAPNETSKDATKAEQIPYKQIIDYLNEKTSKSFKHTATTNKKLIKARWNEGYRLDDFKHVIDTKAAEWLNTEMQKYLQPSTLFGNKFDKYLNEQPKRPAAYKPHVVTENDFEEWELA